MPGRLAAHPRRERNASRLVHARPSQRVCNQRPRPGRAPPAFSRGAPAGEVERFLSGRTNRGPCNGESARVLRPSGGWAWQRWCSASRPSPRTRRHSRDEIHSHRAAPRGRGRVPPGELCAGGKGATRGLESCAWPEAPNLPFRPRARRHAHHEHHERRPGDAEAARSETAPGAGSYRSRSETGLAVSTTRASGPPTGESASPPSSSGRAGSGSTASRSFCRR